MFNSSLINSICKKATTMAFLTAFSLLAFASIGDGGKNKKSTSFLSPVVSQNNSTTFSLKSNLQYRGSQVLSKETTGEFILMKSVVTFQTGNTIHIVPFTQKKLLTKFKTPSKDNL